MWQVLKLEVDDDEDLETETLQMVLWDKDKVTADNVIGSVTCDLHPLLSRSASEIEGWFPVLDSLRGLCGQLRAVVKMTLLIDNNPREVTAAAFFLRSRSITRVPRSMLVLCVSSRRPACPKRSGCSASSVSSTTSPATSTLIPKPRIPFEAAVRATCSA